jgi:hypothetical protein
MNKQQCLRAYRKLWDNITKCDGYQPWGYDVPTMRICHPGFFTAKARLKAAYLEAKS